MSRIFVKLSICINCLEHYKFNFKFFCRSIKWIHGCKKKNGINNSYRLKIENYERFYKIWCKKINNRSTKSHCNQNCLTNSVFLQISKGNWTRTQRKTLAKDLLGDPTLKSGPPSIGQRISNLLGGKLAFFLLAPSPFSSQKTNILSHKQKHTHTYSHLQRTAVDPFTRSSFPLCGG